jgi:hypothetical protein
VFYENQKFENYRFKNGKKQGSDGRIEKRKIAIWNIDSILNCIILSPIRNIEIEVLNLASSKWVYMLKSVENGQDSKV